MELLNKLLDVVITSVGGLVLNMTANDLYDRCPKAARWILSCAVKRVREDQRERYKEEWDAHILMECPTNIDQLRLACRIWWSSASVARQGVRAKTTKLNMTYIIYGCVYGITGDAGTTYLDFKDGAPWGMCANDVFGLASMIFVLVLSIKLRKEKGEIVEMPG